LLRLSHISKTFPGGQGAAGHLAFDLKRGEVHCLVAAENGAGKSDADQKIPFRRQFSPDEGGEIPIRRPCRDT